MITFNELWWNVRQDPFNWAYNWQLLKLWIGEPVIYLFAFSFVVITLYLIRNYFANKSYDMDKNKNDENDKIRIIEE